MEHTGRAEGQGRCASPPLPTASTSPGPTSGWAITDVVVTVISVSRATTNGHQVVGGSIQLTAGLAAPRPG